MPPKRPAPLFDDDDPDYLDELSDDSDEDVKPSDHRQPATLLKGALSPAVYSTLSTRQLHDMIHQGSVELEPSYQRDVVWTVTKMMGLIQSFFLNYYIPPVIFAVYNHPESGEQHRICIDGKQRCTSLIRFMDGEIPFQSPKTKDKFWYSKYGERVSGYQLPESLKRRFDTIQIQAVEYHHISEEQQRDIFQRVQMGVPLSAAEKLQAIPSFWSTWIVELEKKYVLETGTLGERLTWDQTRGRPFQFLASFVILAYNWPQSQRNPSAIQITAFLSRSDKPDANFKARIEMALGILVDVAINYYDVAFGHYANRMAPVELWFSALTAYTQMPYSSVKTIAKNIGEMRTYARTHHRDIRTNSAVVRDLQTWHSSLPRRKDRNDIPAAEGFEGDDVDYREQRAAKRSRQAEDRDPTFRGPAIPRDSESALSGTRTTKNANGTPNGVVQTPARLTRPVVTPTAPVVRPPPSSMDRPATNFAHGQSIANPINPYTTAYQTPGQANGQRAPGQQQNQGFTPEQMSHFAAIARNQSASTSQGNRWNTTG